MGFLCHGVLAISCSLDLGVSPPKVPASQQAVEFPAYDGVPLVPRPVDPLGGTDEPHRPQGHVEVVIGYAFHDRRGLLVPFLAGEGCAPLVLRRAGRSASAIRRSRWRSSPRRTTGE